MRAVRYSSCNLNFAQIQNTVYKNHLVLQKILYKIIRTHLPFGIRSGLLLFGHGFLQEKIYPAHKKRPAITAQSPKGTEFAAFCFNRPFPPHKTGFSRLVHLYRSCIRFLPLETPLHIPCGHGRGPIQLSSS